MSCLCNIVDDYGWLIILAVVAYFLCNECGSATSGSRGCGCGCG